MEKFKNSSLEMPIIPQTSTMRDLRTTSANSINLDTIKCWYYHPLSRVELAKGLNFQ